MSEKIIELHVITNFIQSFRNPLYFFCSCFFIVVVNFNQLQESTKLLAKHNIITWQETVLTHDIYD